MNILVVCHYGLYENLSFSFVHNQIREYAALGHKVRVLVPLGFGKRDRKGKRFSLNQKPFLLDGVEIVDFRYLTLSSYGERTFNVASAITALRLNSALANFTPDIIHAHTLGFDSKIGAWLKKKYGCPLVVTTHGSDTELPLRAGKITEFCRDCNEADAIVAVSSKLADRVRSCGTTTPVHTILSGFVPHTVSQQRNPFGMIAVCNLIPLKRVDMTIRALSLLKEKYPAMTLTVVGQGGERENLEALAKQLSVADAVTFTGRLTNAMAREEMGKNTFFVMVSAPEGFGIAYVEAMSTGCIAVGTKGEGIADVIKDGENGFLVPVDSPQAIADVIDKCLSDTAFAKEIAEKGLITAQTLTWKNTTQHLLHLFETLI